MAEILVNSRILLHGKVAFKNLLVVVRESVNRAKGNETEKIISSLNITDGVGNSVMV